MGCKELLLGFLAPLPFYLFGYVARMGIECDKMEIVIGFILIGSILTMAALMVSQYVSMPHGLSQGGVTLLARCATIGVIFVLLFVSMGLAQPWSVYCSPVVLPMTSAIAAAMCILIVSCHIRHAVYVSSESTHSQIDRPSGHV